MSESDFIADGVKLGYKDVELRDYGKQRCDRNERALERERIREKEQFDLRKLEVGKEKEIELDRLELEREKIRADNFQAIHGRVDVRKKMELKFKIRDTEVTPNDRESTSKVSMMAVETRAQKLAENVPEVSSILSSSALRLDMNELTKEALIQMQSDDPTLKSCFEKSNEIVCLMSEMFRQATQGAID
ncbi:hypothetical protein HAZT_HAZT010213 [Hyalella azteca]|uniref:Uncharacterized protein n=1 Tax=Hyalella azteca TaxID=294128 RepID=A0A6A0GYL9_HYAAZ|nr:hypothetical protein HAZT_HAZT010213 [Hyalella azteca]